MRRGPAVVLLLSLLVAAGYGAQFALAEGWARVIDFAPAHFVASRPATGPTQLTDRLILVMIDGLHPDDASLLPSLDWLGRRGSRYRLDVTPPGYQVPVAATLMTGAPPTLHGILLTNLEHPLLADSLPAAAARARLTVGGIGSPALGQLLRPAIGHWVDVESLDSLAETVRPHLAADGPRLLIVQAAALSEKAGRIDRAGVRTPEHLQLLGQVDGQLVRMLELIDLRTSTVMVIGTNPNPVRGAASAYHPLPLILAGKGIKPGVTGEASIMDVAPTASALLGAPTPLQNQGRPLLTILDVTERPAAVIVNRYVDARKSFTDSALLSLGIPTPAPDIPATATETDEYLASLKQLLREAQFMRWKDSALERLPYLGGGMLVLVLYLILVLRLPYGGALLVGIVTYSTLFQLGFFMLGGRYSVTMGGLEGLNRDGVATLGLTTAGAMAITSLLCGFLLSRKGFRKRTYLTVASFHMALAILVSTVLPVTGLLLFTGWEFPVELPSVGLLIWFLVSCLQVLIIGFMSPIWAILAVVATRVAIRLWPLKEVGDPEQNADKVVRLRTLKRTGRRRA